MGFIDTLPEPYDQYRNLPWHELEIVSRQEWGALPPKFTEEFKKFPVRNIILGYTETDKCEDKESCIRMMQELQKKHMEEGEPDIRFSYVVGWDQRVYEARGFRTKAGTHPRYPHLKGTNVEVVLSGQRGEIPTPGVKSSIMYRLIDVHSYDDGPLDYTNPFMFLDYDENANVDDDKLIAEVVELNKQSKPIFAKLKAEYTEMWGEE